VESPFTEIGLIGTVYYFAYLLILMPFLGYLDKFLMSRVSN
jgi:hypothetical protein